MFMAETGCRLARDCRAFVLECVSRFPMSHVLEMTHLRSARVWIRGCRPMHAALVTCQLASTSDRGKKQLASLSSYSLFQVVSDHLAVNAGSCSGHQLKENLDPLT